MRVSLQLSAGRTVLVTGASGIVGYPLLPLLAAAGFQVLAMSRQAADSNSAAGVRWIAADLERAHYGSAPPAAAVLIHAAPLWLLHRHLPRFFDCGVSRVVAFSSTSVESKVAARGERDRRLAEVLKESEQRCMDTCHQAGAALTLFRPTLVYGFGRDRNISVIARFIKRYRFFAVAGAGSGKRQPVHAQDLAASCLRVIDNQATVGRVYALSGAEVLTYRDMLVRIFQCLRLPVRMLRLPVSVYRVGLRCASVLGDRQAWSPDIADRMNQDLCFSHEQANTDFGYAPSRFLTIPERDLPIQPL